MASRKRRASEVSRCDTDADEPFRVRDARLGLGEWFGASPASDSSVHVFWTLVGRCCRAFFKARRPGLRIGQKRIGSSVSYSTRPHISR